MIKDRIDILIQNTESIDIKDVLLTQFKDDVIKAIIDSIFTERVGGNTLRLSGIGKCLRSQFYTLQGTPKKPLSSRAKLTFLYGHIVEALAVLLAKKAGCVITDEQKEVELHGVKGHIDGILHHEGKRYLFECKSMSDRSFKDFKSNGMSNKWGYISQANSYAYALGLDGILWLGFNKSTGEFYEEPRDINTGLVIDTIKDIDRLNSATGPEHFHRPEPEVETWYGKPTGNMTVPVVCGYCDYVETCYSGKVTTMIRGSSTKKYLGEIKHGKWTAGGKLKEV